MEDAAPPEPATARSRPPPRETESLPARWKAWGEAVSAVLKPVLLLGAIAAVAIVATAAVWRDQTTRRIIVEISPDTEKTLLELGSDLDLRQTLVDELNGRIHAVQQIVAVQNLTTLVDSTGAKAIDFKPFGLALSTDDVTAMVREVLGSPPPARARIDLNCEPACSGGAATRGTLLFTLSASRGGKRLAFPVPLAGPGLRRRLHQAMQSGADLLLEEDNPLVASIYDLNPPADTLFIDAARERWNRAEGLALAARGGEAKDRCIAGLVIRGSLIKRGLLREGVAALHRNSDVPDPVCRVYGDSSIVSTLAWTAACYPSREVRAYALDQERQALERLPKDNVGGQDPLVAARIPASELTVELLAPIQDLTDPARLALCTGVNVSTGAPAAGAAMAATIEKLLHVTLKVLPPDQTLQFEHGAFRLLAGLFLAGIPADDAVDRYATARRMIETIERYALVERHPRYLFFLEGQFAMEMVRAVRRAIEMDAADRARFMAVLDLPTPTLRDDPGTALFYAGSLALAEAAAAFGNASATDTASQVLDPIPDIKPLMEFGDTLFVEGQEAEAGDAYARATDAFIQDDEPVDQIIEFAKVAARAAGLLIASGACDPGAAPSRAWDERWARLGGHADVCGLLHPPPEAADPSLLGMLRPLIDSAVIPCVMPLLKALTTAATPTAKAIARSDYIECERRTGPGDPRAAQAFIAQRTEIGMDADIEAALSARP